MSTSQFLVFFLWSSTPFPLSSYKLTIYKPLLFRLIHPYILPASAISSVLVTLYTLTIVTDFDCCCFSLTFRSLHQQTFSYLLNSLFRWTTIMLFDDAPPHDNNVLQETSTASTSNATMDSKRHFSSLYYIIRNLGCEALVLPTVLQWLWRSR